MFKFKICPNFFDLLTGFFSWPVLMWCLPALVILLGYLPFHLRKAPAERQAAVRKLLRGGLFLLAFPILLETLATLVLSYTNHCFGKMFAGETGAMILIGLLLLVASGTLAVLGKAVRKN